MLELTPEQQKEFHKEKIIKFQKGLDKLEKDTNMKMIPTLQSTQLGIKPVLTLVPNVPKKEK